MTHICKRAEGAQEANGDQAQNEELPPLGQKIWVLVHYSGDDSLQTSKLQIKSY